MTLKSIFLHLAGKVLIAALDWGMGHATRCVPLIRHYLEQGNEVVLASNGTAASFFADYFPELELRTDLPAYAIQYPSSGAMTFAMMRQAPRILSVIREEEAWLNINQKTEKWDRIISDNRYGLHDPSVESVLITHQLYIQAPFFAKPLLNYQVRQWARPFDAIWIPDFSGPNNLSGVLSHGDKPFPKAEFISPLSRFKDIPTGAPPKEIPDVLALISGPEPQRSLLSTRLIELFHKTGANAVVVGGQPGSTNALRQGNVMCYPHLPDRELAQLILFSKIIICRSGYSTLMDLHALGRKALLIPTPGQTEQEYLASYHTLKHGFTSLQQKHLEVAMLAERLQTLQLKAQ